MAAYFHGSGSEIQSSADGLQTLYLMNPNNYAPYTDNNQHPAVAPPNMLFLNPTVSGNAHNLSNLPHAPPPSPLQPLFGITLPSNMVGSSNSDDPCRSSILAQHEISGIQGVSAPRVQYHLWGSVMDQTASSTAGTATVSSGGATTGTMDVSSQMGFRRPNQQGLSLSLSSQQTPYNSLPREIDFPSHGNQFPSLSPASGGGGSDHIRVPGYSSSSVSNGITDMRSVILGSKYLKAAQELLDEVVSVGKAINKVETEERVKEKMKMDHEESRGAMGDASCGTSDDNNNNSSSSSKQGAELTTAQRQELQMKKTKLVSMLDEVEQRYRQYRHQIQTVVSSFEQAAGYGAAKAYTSLALKTISKQFRCLKDAISSQIKATSKSLGEDYCLGAKIEGSRLRFVDHHLRQQRALQQLGMIHHNAWRPQRGLPERAVSVLRAWLFEHFLHPYPKDSDKVLLAKQTGLTRSQVSNWFINARVRLWKPMVEEMYTEEVKEQEHKNSGDNSSRLKESNKERASMASTAQESDTVRQADQMKARQSKPETFTHQNVSAAEISVSSMSTSPSGGCLQSHSGFNLLVPGDMHRSPHKTRNSEMQNSPSSILSVGMETKAGETNRDVGAEFGINRQSKSGYPLISENPNQSGLYGAYSVGDIGRFESEELTPRYHGNGVSLTLGLPHSENLSLSGNQHGMGYLPLHNMQLGRLEVGATGTEFCAISTPQSSYSSNGFDSIDIRNRKRFAAQLLPDFVAR